MASSSSAHQNPRHLLNHLYGGGSTSAPPPTPSAQQPPSLSSTSDSAAADTLSRLLHRLPPNLSLPTRLSPRGAAKSSSPQQSLPTLSLSSTSFPCSSSGSSSIELGYFQLTHHSITPQLAESAESDSLSLFELPLDVKLSSFPNEEWPLGFNNNDDDNNDDDDDRKTGSFCLDAQCTTTDSTDLSLASLRELTRELEKVGLEVVEKLACEIGFENLFREEGERVGPKKYSTLMWVSSSDGEKGREVYPYVVGLQYQIRARKLDLVSDSGAVIVEPQVGSLLVTLGDIAQVWSNGKLKKVRGRAAPVLDDASSSLPCISMTMLITLPLESTVSPLLNILNKSIDHNNREKEACEPEDQGKECNINGNDHHSIEPSISSTNDGIIDDGHEDRRVFNSFSFEDYAWRVYHERLLIKDPLDRYRVID